ncbi:MAG: SHOCT domain-containing protein [Candidatus Accumulibacter sp.]|uniref:SHOCT domain-containing protein n=1 Tax=Candidatus Accumulibacter affinis TaxID=2954384 RepID=A0A935TBY8_9PROT|nr:SHOCT domain-containing protein [Candidatus Accumulibacter affinis]
MRQLSSSGQQAINEIAQRHGFSANAVLSMLESVINGNGSMAQFSHPEFSGSGQWMRGGMIMVSDLFDNYLKGRIDGLCNELSKLIADQPDLIRSGSFQSQSQGGPGGYDAGQLQSNFAGAQQAGSSGQLAAVSLFVPPAPGTSGDWWPADLHAPNSTGAQNGVRYAYFAQAQRLAIDVGGAVTVYDTLDHRIAGFSQQQSVGGTLSFSSQYGLIDVASLPVVFSSTGQPPRSPATLPSPSPANSRSQGSAPPPGRDQDVFATIERLADLKAKGILSDEEFSAKKTELLSRI